MALSLTEADRYALLEVTTFLVDNQPSDVFALTNCAGPLDLSDPLIYQPEPTMVFDIPSYTGDVNTKQATIKMADRYDVWRDMLSGRATARRRCRLSEVAFDINNPAASNRIRLWEGFVQAVEINPDGEEGIVEITVGRCGGNFDRELGPEVSNYCWKTFGDFKTCRVNAAGNLDPTLNIQGLEITADIVALTDGRTTVQITNPAAVNQPEYYWQNGSVTAGDVRISIRSWKDGDLFTLSEFPPQSWIDALPFTVTLRPGCRKTLADCRRYDNEINYGGLGIRVPARNVLYELP